MSAGYHLDVFDYVGNEALAEEARELARSVNFTPPMISAGLDLMLNFARRQDVGRAEKLIDQVAESAAAATAWHTSRLCSYASRASCWRSMEAKRSRSR